jgi:uncharacterized protein YabE (DUF348 family)/3D (Asp-Asp-Asp) domain-containing protein
MKTKTRWLILTGALVILMVAGYLLMGRDIPVTIDGQTSMMHTRALTVAQALGGIGIKLTSDDQVDPPANSWLSGVKTITLDRSRTLTIWVDPNGARVNVNTPAKTARAALALLGINPTAEDGLKLNGSSIQLDDPLPEGVSLLLQYTPAQQIQLTQNGEQKVIHSTAATLGQALWQNGIHLTGGDLLSSPFTQPLTAALDVSLTSAIPLTISVDGKTIQTSSAAPTVGAALAANGISLQNLDYSTPAESSPLPQDGKIQVVRVKFVVLDQQKVTPYTTEYTTDTSLAAGEKEVTRTGQNGISNVRVLVRYENNVEVSRETEAEEVIQIAINEQVSSNSQASVNANATQTSTTGAIGTIDTGSGTLSYYYSLSVHATSYSPCRSGGSSCSNLTASGTQVTKGVLAVTPAWYKILKGYNIYIPGYGIGTVEDTGGGISGQYWIDLGYSDSDWVTWSKFVTVYFLTPTPANFSGSLP